MKVNVGIDDVDVKKWEKVHGETVELEGARQVVTRYYGTCPFCKSEILNDEIVGLYADPEYWDYCPNCGTDMKSKR